MIEIDIANMQSQVPVDVRVLESALCQGLEQESVAGAVLSVTIVDNQTIHQINRTHLNHDYPTDVISFQLDWASDTAEAPSTDASQRSAGATIEGEIVVSAEYAASFAQQCGWPVLNELILYAIHGMLHICGYDDQTPDEKRQMRHRERAILESMGLDVPYPDDRAEEDAASGCDTSTASGPEDRL